MSDITLEKNHALLEKLAEYVMNELPTRKEVDEKLALVHEELAQVREELSRTATKDELTMVRIELSKMATKNELGQLRTEMNQKFDQILQGQDAQAGQLDDLRIEKVAISHTLDVHEERLGTLEERSLGYRVRDVDAGKEEGEITN